MSAAAPITAAARFLQQLFAHRAATRRATATYKPAMQQFKAADQSHAQDEKNRSARIQGLNDTIGHVAATVPGMPDYSVSPEVRAQLSTPRPYTGAVPVNPGAGLGNQFLSGLFGSIGDVGNTIMSGQAAGAAGAAGAGGAPNTYPSFEGNLPAGSDPNFDYGAAGTGGVSAMSRICQLYPDLPSCHSAPPPDPAAGGIL